MRADGATLQAIADHFGVARAAVWQSLHRVTCRTNRAHVPSSCLCGCGARTVRRKYASRDCYFAHTVARLAGDAPYVVSRWGQKVARELVAQHFTLEPQHVVHHVDRNSTNNALENLWVFASQGDHVSHHRGGVAQPIWRGDGGPVGEAGLHRTRA